MILIGFMGAGKTTVGRLLGKRLGLTFLDLDAAICADAQKTIPELFSERGEAGFRLLEFETLRKHVGSPLVLSTGGGCVETEAVRSLLKGRANVVYLASSFDHLYERITRDVSVVRPIVSAKSRQELEALYQSRLALYDEVADVRLDTDGLTAWQVAEQLQLLSRQQLS